MTGIVPHVADPGSTPGGGWTAEGLADALEHHVFSSVGASPSRGPDLMLSAASVLRRQDAIVEAVAALPGSEPLVKFAGVAPVPFDREMFGHPQWADGWNQAMAAITAIIETASEPT